MKRVIYIRKRCGWRRGLFNVLIILSLVVSQNSAWVRAAYAEEVPPVPELEVTVSNVGESSSASDNSAEAVSGDNETDDNNDETSKQENTVSSEEPKDDQNVSSESNNQDTIPEPENETNSNSQEPTESNEQLSGQPADQEIQNTNNADVAATAEASAQTGGNTAENNAVSENSVADVSSENPDNTAAAVIDTSDAQADAVIVNDVNTNIVGDTQTALYNITGQESGDINLLETFAVQSSSVVVEPDQSSQEINNAESENEEHSPQTETIENTNVAEIDNTAIANADTGNNSASGSTGDAEIATGDAAASADIVNIANRNLVGDDGLMAVINIFGEWVGDLIVPGEGVLTVLEKDGVRYVVIKNKNEADVENTVIAEANTGNNTAEENGGSSEIVTGAALAAANVVTLANMNIIGSNWFLLIINNFGEWDGTVVGAEQQDAYGYEFETREGNGGECPTGCDAKIVSVSNDNKAIIKNTATATANTGGNIANGNTGGAGITTGNAISRANIFNLLNLNIVGDNWFFGIVNNFGLWRGNLVFAHPDLDVSISDGRDTAFPGDSFAYEITVRNEGQADAAATAISLDLPSGAFLLSGDNEWHLPSLKAGESFSAKVEIKVSEEIVPNTHLIAGVEASTENNEQALDNNSAQDETIIAAIPIAETEYSGDRFGEFQEPKFSVSRSSSVNGSAHPGDTISHKVIVKNTGKSPAFDVVVQDTLIDNAQNSMATLSWPIGNLSPGEKAIVEYSLAVPITAPSGEYHNEARAIGIDATGDDVKSKKLALAFNIFGILPAQAASVAGVSDENNIEQISISPDIPLADIPKTNLPLWMLMFSALAYALFINWSLFPRSYFIAHHYEIS